MSMGTSSSSPMSQINAVTLHPARHEPVYSMDPRVGGRSIDDPRPLAPTGNRSIRCPNSARIGNPWNPSMPGFILNPGMRAPHACYWNTPKPPFPASLKNSLPTGGVIDIVLSPNTEHFQNIQPGTPPKWADATAWPRSGLIFLRAPAARANSVRPLTQVLDHEIVHVVLGRAFAPNPVPRWLQEGTAQLLALEYTPEVTEQLASGLLGDTLLELGDLTTGFPSGPSKARLAYAQSADFMAHIRAEYGEEAFQNLIQHLVDGKPTDAAIRLTLGKSMTDVDKEWRSRLESGPLWLQAVVNDTTLLAVTGLLFAVGYWRFRGRKRAVLDEWEREENERDALYAQMNQQWERNQYWVIDGDFTEHEWSATDSESTTGSQWQPKNPL